MEDIDYAEYLSSQAHSEAAAMHKFTVLFSEQDKAVHLFFEGEEDPSFYTSCVRRFSGTRPIRTYICGGKLNVIGVRRQILAEGYPIAGCLFFVDRDYDDFAGTQIDPEPNTYITDYYSIESELVTEQAVEAFLVETVGMSHADPEFIRIQKTVATARANFQKKVFPLMVWSIAAKVAKARPNFNNAQMGKLFEVTLDGFVKKEPKAFRAFRVSVKSNGKKVALSEMRRWRILVRDVDPKLWLRGKYELWLLETALLAVLKDVASKRKSDGKKALKIPSSLRDHSLFDSLGARIPVAESLQRFLAEKLAAA